MSIKYTCDSKSRTLRMRYPFQSTGRPISRRNVCLFCVYMIPLRVFVPERNSRPGTTTGVNSRRGDSRRHNILWWYHVNKCRAMRGNRSELASGRKSPRCHVNTPYIQSGKYTRTKLLFLQSEKRLLIGRECATCHVSRKAVKFSAVFFFGFSLETVINWECCFLVPR